MALCLYNAVMAYPWATWTSLREAWAVAEHYMQTYSDNLKVYAALLIDAQTLPEDILPLGASQLLAISTSMLMASQVISPHRSGGTTGGLHGAT